MERKGGQPRAKDTFLVIEVADSSLARDRGLKQCLYAEAGITCYWVVNAVAFQVEVYTRPDLTSRKYRNRTDYKLGHGVPLVIRKDTVALISIDAVFPYASQKS